MQWWEETVHALVVMHDFKQQKQLEGAIRELVRLGVRRAELEGFQQGYEDGKRRAVKLEGTCCPWRADAGPAALTFA